MELHTKVLQRLFRKHFLTLPWDGSDWGKVEGLVINVSVTENVLH